MNGIKDHILNLINTVDVKKLSLKEGCGRITIMINPEKVVPEKPEPKKRGRKPMDPSLQEKPEPKKRGRKPMDPSLKEKPEPKKRGRKP
ncbi:hypothetical protein EBY67_02975, partial [bacterium]|nr:hypothetical protein [Verrucomicrobiota bacterium]NDH86002.1 hypothetical protein [bacterium]NDI16887.1 hypothetical protein [Verrucomicrobiota bacterium]